jgi:Protein of unknown function (DUF3667)
MMDSQVQSQDRHCLECDAPLTGAFCSHCGQDASTERLRYVTLAVESILHFFAIGGPLLHTIGGLFRSPSRVISEYTRGRRRSYTGPIRYSLLMAALGVLMRRFFFPDGIVVMDQANVGFAEMGIQEAMDQVNNFMASYEQPLMLLILPIYAALLRLFFKDSGHSYSEQLAFSCYLFGHLGLISLPFIPFGIPAHAILTFGLGVILPLILLSWWVIGFNKVSRKTGIIRAILVFAIFQAFLTSSLFCAGFIVKAIQQ